MIFVILYDYQLNERAQGKMQNIISRVKSLVIGTGVSKKSNTEYTYIDITFTNGYVYRGFLSQEQKFILNSVAKSVDSPITESEDFVNFLED